MNRRAAHNIRAGIIIARKDHEHIQDFHPAIRPGMFAELLATGGPRDRAGSLAYAVTLDALARKARQHDAVASLYANLGDLARKWADATR